MDFFPAKNKHPSKKTSAEAAFPAGLEQPEDSFHFSTDALLLAAFTAALPLQDQACLADLGTGCGIVALATLLKKTDWKAIGLEQQAALVSSAIHNSESLNLQERMSVLCGDVAERRSLLNLRRLLKEKTGHPDDLPLFDVVTCNPPWHREGEGRIPSSYLRKTALFGKKDTFSTFFSAADTLLRHRGILAVICGASRTAEILSALPTRLHPEILRFVFTRTDAPATFLLLAARKNGRSSLRVEKTYVDEQSPYKI